LHSNETKKHSEKRLICCQIPAHWLFCKGWDYRRRLHLRQWSTCSYSASRRGACRHGTGYTRCRLRIQGYHTRHSHKNF